MLDILTDEKIKQTYMLPDFDGREAAVPLFRRLMELSNDSSKYVRAIANEDGLVGFLNYTEILYASIELGYVIHPDFQCRGYMTEALQLAVGELFDMGYREVITGAFSTNTASIRVMEKCGMQPLEKTEEINYRNQTHRCVYYSINQSGVKQC
jgi:RimJ/RimL family protein N-acetyltransferase